MKEKRARYHHGDLRRSLIAEALGLVAEQGVAALSLREVARRAGVSQAAPYRHFANKDALVAAVAEEGYRATHRAIRRALATAPSTTVERLQAIGAAYIRYAVDHPAQFRVMFGQEVAATHGFASCWEAAQANFDELIAEIRAGQAAGSLVGEQPEAAARAVWSALHGLASLLVDGLLARQGLGPDRRHGATALARQVLQAVLEGLLRRPR
jgi:AcrR family transcriptional regulator